MNNSLTLGRASAALAALTALVHGAVGSFDTLYPALDSVQPLALFGVIEGAWHMLGLLMLWCAWVFWSGREGVRALGLIWMLSGVIFFAAGFFRGGFDGLVRVPQWILLLPTGLLAILSRKSRRG